MEDNFNWELILLYIFHMKRKQWKDFEDDIKHNHRYFPKNELLDDIKRMQEYAVYNRLVRKPYES